MLRLCKQRSRGYELCKNRVLALAHFLREPYITLAGVSRESLCYRWIRLVSGFAQVFFLEQLEHSEPSNLRLNVRCQI